MQFGFVDSKQGARLARLNKPIRLTNEIISSARPYMCAKFKFQLIKFTFVLVRRLHDQQRITNTVLRPLRTVKQFSFQISFKNSMVRNVLYM